MSSAKLFGLALASSVLLSACVAPNGAVIPSLVPVYPAVPQPAPAPVSYVDVYQYSGVRQCESGSGIPLFEGQRKLQAAGINVTNTSCGTDGRVYPSMCGSGTGQIQIFTINSDAAPLAQSHGFMMLNNMPQARRIECPTNANNANMNNKNSSNIPYTGGYNPSYYSYQ